MGSLLSCFLSADPAAAAAVSSFHSSELWKRHFNRFKDTTKFMVVDFSVPRCGRCRFIEPVFNAMAAQFTDVDFVKIDVDELSDVAQEYEVQAMPTFVVLKNGKEIDRVVGAKKEELEKRIEMHGATATQS